MNRVRRHIAPLTFVALLLAVMVSSCQRKPLYLVQHGNVSIATGEFDIRLEMLWGMDWQTQWQYPAEMWDESKFGRIGYDEPTGVHVIAYQLNDEMERFRWHYDRHIGIKGGRVQLATNSHYDMLLYNDDTEWIRFIDRGGSDYSTFNVTTGTNSRAKYTRSYAGYNQPDQLFGTLIDEVYISDDPDDYVMERNEDGSITYVCKMDASLQPYTFIYLYQVILRNNRTDEGDAIVSSAVGLTANGLASGADLFTRRTHSSIVSLTQDRVAPLVKDRMLTFPDGTQETADILGARIQTWGMPDMVPLEEVTRGGIVEPADSTLVGVGLRLHNGYTYVMQKNVTEQMKERPAGGVITLVIDVTKEIPDSIINYKGGGGFQPTVNQWDNEVHTEIEI